jgi:hypothetical protein
MDDDNSQRFDIGSASNTDIATTDIASDIANEVTDIEEVKAGEVLENNETEPEKNNDNSK